MLPSGMRKGGYVVYRQTVELMDTLTAAADEYG